MSHARWRMRTDLELIFEEISCTGNLTAKPLKGGEGKKGRKQGSGRAGPMAKHSYTHPVCGWRKLIEARNFWESVLPRPRPDYSFPFSLWRFTCALGVSPGEFGLKGCLTDGILCVRLTVGNARCGHWEQRGSSNLRSRGYWLLGGIIRNYLKMGDRENENFFKDVKFPGLDACFVGLNVNGDEILFWLLVIKLWIFV